MHVVVAGLLLSGYIVALVPARLCHLDIGSFRRTLWTGIGHRDRWLHSITVAYLALGWPAFLVIVAWRTSRTRKGLVELRAQMRDSPTNSGSRSVT
jgi:hypothetical protein